MYLRGFTIFVNACIRGGGNTYEKFDFFYVLIGNFDYFLKVMLIILSILIRCFNTFERSHL